MKITKPRIALISLLAVGVLAACGGTGSSQPSAQEKVNRGANAIPPYVVQHFIEVRNINLKDKIFDDPSTILWCTEFPPTNQALPFTVPIAGKLTSGGKRLWPTSQANTNKDDGFYSPEKRGQDGTFGTSSDYRYGFDPTLTVYTDFANIAQTCSTKPTVWQMTKTIIDVQTDPTAANLTLAASQAIKKGNPAKALELLKKVQTLQQNRGVVK